MGWLIDFGKSLLAITFVLIFCGFAQAESLEDKVLRLERIINAQQQQIDQQSKQIDQLNQKINGQPSAKTVPADLPDAPQAPNRAITSSNDKVKVELYGQLDRGALFVNDGDKSKLYQVDNDNSSTRLGLRGSVKPHAEWTIGTRFEVEYQSNASNEVNREETSTSGEFNDRHIDIFLQSDTFGKLSIGKGDTASNNTSEVDLSGTTVAAYSDIPAVAGGQLFFDKSTDTLSDVQISDVFNNFDGLSRKNRLRYDTPAWRGLHAATSIVSGTGGDIALFYNGKTDQFKIAAAGAYSDPGSDSDTVDNSWDGSASLLLQNGLNFTIAAGLRELKDSGRDDPTFFYTKVGYIAELLSAGKTAFSIDYSFNEDLDQDGDEADAIGLQLVQNIDSWATEFYLSYRFHSLDRSGSNFDDIHAVLSGLRVKF